MDVQNCSDDVVMVDLGPDPQGDMVRRQIAFERRLGREHSYRTVLHSLDMACQEASEAWDMLEGGWKHHKRRPRPADRNELVMELVDVLHFVINAYLHCGGLADAASVATAVARYIERPADGPLGLAEGWIAASDLFDQVHTGRSYHHGDGAHGQSWEKDVAARVNWMRARIIIASERIRTAEHEGVEDWRYLQGMVWVEGAVSVYATAASVPDCTAQELYSCFLHKNAINNRRQDVGY